MHFRQIQKFPVQFTSKHWQSIAKNLNKTKILSEELNKKLETLNKTNNNNNRDPKSDFNYPINPSVFEFIRELCVPNYSRSKALRHPPLLPVISSCNGPPCCSRSFPLRPSTTCSKIKRELRVTKRYRRSTNAITVSRANSERLFAKRKIALRHKKSREQRDRLRPIPSKYDRVSPLSASFLEVINEGLVEHRSFLENRSLTRDLKKRKDENPELLEALHSRPVSKGKNCLEHNTAPVIQNPDVSKDGTQKPNQKFRDLKKQYAVKDPAILVEASHTRPVSRNRNSSLVNRSLLDQSPNESNAQLKGDVSQNQKGSYSNGNNKTMLQVDATSIQNQIRDYSTYKSSDNKSPHSRSVSPVLETKYSTERVDPNVLGKTTLLSVDKPINTQSRSYSSKKKGKHSRDRSPADLVSCPEPPTDKDKQGLPYFYRRQAVADEDGKSIKYEMQRVYFSYPGQVVKKVMSEKREIPNLSKTKVPQAAKTSEPAKPKPTTKVDETPTTMSATVDNNVTIIEKHVLPMTSQESKTPSLKVESRTIISKENMVPTAGKQASSKIIYHREIITKTKEKISEAEYLKEVSVSGANQTKPPRIGTPDSGHRTDSYSKVHQKPIPQDPSKTNVNTQYRRKFFTDSIDLSPTKQTVSTNNVDCMSFGTSFQGTNRTNYSFLEPTALEYTKILARCSNAASVKPIEKPRKNLVSHMLASPNLGYPIPTVELNQIFENQSHKFSGETEFLPPADVPPADVPSSNVPQVDTILADLFKEVDTYLGTQDSITIPEDRLPVKDTFFSRQDLNGPFLKESNLQKPKPSPTRDIIQEQKLADELNFYRSKLRHAKCMQEKQEPLNEINLQKSKLKPIQNNFDYNSSFFKPPCTNKDIQLNEPSKPVKQLDIKPDIIPQIIPLMDLSNKLQTNQHLGTINVILPKTVITPQINSGTKSRPASRDLTEKPIGIVHVMLPKIEVPILPKKTSVFAKKNISFENWDKSIEKRPTFGNMSTRQKSMENPSKLEVVKKFESTNKPITEKVEKKFESPYKPITEKVERKFESPNKPILEKVEKKFESANKHITEKVEKKFESENKPITEKVVKKFESANKPILEKVEMKFESANKPITEKVEKKFESANKHITEKVERKFESANKPITEKVEKKFESANKPITEKVEKKFESANKPITEKVEMKFESPYKPITEKVEMKFESPYKPITEKVEKKFESPYKPITEKVEMKFESPYKPITEKVEKKFESPNKPITETVVKRQISQNKIGQLSAHFRKTSTKKYDLPPKQTYTLSPYERTKTAMDFNKVGKNLAEAQLKANLKKLMNQVGATSKAAFVSKPPLIQLQLNTVPCPSDMPRVDPWIPEWGPVYFDGCKRKKTSCGKSSGCKKKKDPCEKKKDPCKKDPCKKDPCKKDPCKKDPCAKKKDPCKKDPCKKDPCKKDPCKKDPCKKDPCKKDPCAKKKDPCAPKPCPCPKPSPCGKPDPCAKKSPCKKDPCAPKPKPKPCCPKSDPCGKKDPCKKDPCAKKDPCKKDPCKKDPCKKDPCKKDPCAKKSPCKKDPCKKDPCKKDPCKKDPCKKDPCAKKCGEANVVPCEMKCDMMYDKKLVNIIKPAFRDNKSGSENKKNTCCPEPSGSKKKISCGTTSSPCAEMKAPCVVNPVICSPKPDACAVNCDKSPEESYINIPKRIPKCRATKKGVRKYSYKRMSNKNLMKKSFSCDTQKSKSANCLEKRKSDPYLDRKNPYSSDSKKSGTCGSGDPCPKIPDPCENPCPKRAACDPCAKSCDPCKPKEPTCDPCTAKPNPCADPCAKTPAPCDPCCAKASPAPKQSPCQPCGDPDPCASKKKHDPYKKAPRIDPAVSQPKICDQCQDLSKPVDALDREKCKPPCHPCPTVNIVKKKRPKLWDRWEAKAKPCRLEADTPLCLPAGPVEKIKKPKPKYRKHVVKLRPPKCKQRKCKDESCEPKIQKGPQDYCSSRKPSKLSKANSKSCVQSSNDPCNTSSIRDFSKYGLREQQCVHRKAPFDPCEKFPIKCGAKPRPAIIRIYKPSANETIVVGPRTENDAFNKICKPRKRRPMTDCKSEIFFARPKRDKVIVPELSEIDKKSLKARLNMMKCKQTRAAKSLPNLKNLTKEIEEPQYIRIRREMQKAGKKHTEQTKKNNSIKTKFEYK